MTSLNAAGHARPPGSFVGRELELAELRAGLTDAATGHGHLFLLSGEPGIGKTKLADDPCATFMPSPDVHTPATRCRRSSAAQARAQRPRQPAEAATPSNYFLCRDPGAGFAPSYWVNAPQRRVTN